MKLAAICPVFRRPKLLPNALANFVSQNLSAEHSARLIILDDAGQFDEQTNEEQRWEIRSAPVRFHSLSAKFNALVRLAKASGADACVVWEDDDVYLPHHLQYHAEQLSSGTCFWSIPRKKYVDVHRRPGVDPENLQLIDLRCETRDQPWCHASWAFWIDLWNHVNGYDESKSNGFDLDFGARCPGTPGDYTDLIGRREPQYVYRWLSHGYANGSGIEGDYYAKFATMGDGERVPGKVFPQFDAGTLRLRKLLGYESPTFDVPKIEQLFHAAVATPSDINEHLATLRNLAAECDHVTEMGSRNGNSTTALLAGQPKTLVAIDVQDQERAIGRLREAAGRTDLRLIQGDTRTIDIEETDCLLIDTLHTAKQLAIELNRHAPKVRRKIALHDTTTFGEVGEGGKPGLKVALREWLPRHPEWHIIAEHTNNNGLTIMSRTARRVPIIITNRDRLDWTRNAVAACKRLPGAEVFIVDNDSTYPPLLEWYDTQTECRVFRLNENRGPRAAWSVLAEVIGESENYVVTDNDLDLSKIPLDTLDVFAWSLRDFPEFHKAGLALRIDDLPDTPQGRTAREVEGKFWSDELRWPDPYRVPGRIIYRAAVDTTFAMYRVNPAYGGQYEPALRFAGDYTVDHLPWRQTAATLNEDDRHYLARMNGAGLFYSPKMAAELAAAT